MKEQHTYDIDYSKYYRMLKLTLEQKCVIAAREIDDLKEEIEAKQIEREKQLDHHKVSAHHNGVDTVSRRP